MIDEPMNKISIVTGANSGLGKATARLLVENNFHVVMVVRNKDKGIKAIKDLQLKTGKNTMELMLCDFSSQKSIRNFVNEFKKKYSRLDLLINNHGAVFDNKALTEDGLERTFAINYLGFFLLTNLLKDLLISSSPSKIINVSSGAYAATKKWPLQDYNYTSRKFSSFRAYSESKLYCIMFTYYLAKELSSKGITVNAYSPGFTKTNFGSGSVLMKLSMLIAYPFGKSPLKSAETALYLSTSSEVESYSGYYFENKKIKETSELTHNEILQKELWGVSEKLVNLK
ncbi:MAG: SDR family NAD(P)-dependent oxidoreductase [Candidatus Thorarchaeota archaeon]